MRFFEGCAGTRAEAPLNSDAKFVAAVGRPIVSCHVGQLRLSSGKVCFLFVLASSALLVGALYCS